jgi:hypothetical protein
MMIVALVIGEALLIAVTKFCQWLVSPLVVAWLLASVIVAIGGYLIFGLPVLSVYRAASDRKATEPDIRGLWSERILKSGTRLAYVAGSIIGGSPAVAWYYGSRGDAHARSRTMGAAAITAAFWCAFYLGLLTWIFG